jgi:hypothetical protein
MDKKEKVNLKINKRALRVLKNQDLETVAGGRKPPPSHTCATCVSNCQTYSVCNC